MLSFDIESLFTNVPTEETIEIILRKVFQPGVRQFHGMTREILKKLLVICTKESHFQFNGRFYEQIDGVAMGSPLGPLFANAFMSDFEEKHIGKLREMGLNIWLRYVDDVYATVKSKGVEEEILLYLNSQHPNIRFTMELENGDSMPFLDVRVIRRVNKYETTVYHKKTFTGVYLNWTSLTSRKYKVGLIKCLFELLHILKRKPELNKQLNSQSNYDIKTLIIAAYPQFRKNDGKHSEVDRP